MRIGILLFVLVFTIELKAQYWSTLNNVSLGDFNTIYELEEYDSLLYIGGIFNEINGFETTGIVKWDSANFMQVSNMPLAGPNSFELTGDSIFSVGSFNDIGGIEGTNAIGLWNGFEWQSVGGGSQQNTAWIKCCKLYNGKLYIGADFDQMGNINVPFAFASWDGAVWTEEESVYGLSKGPSVMTIYNGELIGGGDFTTTTTGNPMNKVARFDGIHWYDLQGGVNGTVFSLFVDGNDLYVGGTCTLAQFGDVVIPNNVARFDGNNWHPIGNYEEIGNTVRAIALYRGQLYIGGRLTINGIESQYLAYYDGVHWHQVPGSEDMDERVRCLQVYKDELYIGGDFDHAGGHEVPGLVRYYLHPDSVHWGVPDMIEENNTRSFHIFPNPADDMFKVEFDEFADGDLIITDLLGRQYLREFINRRRSLTIQTADLPRGTLLVSQLVGGKLLNTEKVVVR
jgi:hypothetical protein